MPIKLTDEELRFLDCWIAQYIFDCDCIEMGEPGKAYALTLPFGRFPSGYSTIPYYSKFSISSMDVLKWIGEKDFPTIYKSRADGVSWCMDNLRIGGEATISVSAETVPLVICLFAKILYQKLNAHTASR